MTKPKEKAKVLIAFLQQNQNNKGVMADLRCGYSTAKAHRCWPHIANFCKLDNDWSRMIVQTFAASFATHPMNCSDGNLGRTMREIARGKHGKDGLQTFEGRFRRFLNCAETEEVCRLLPGIVRTAKAKSIPINYKQLYCDLCYWNGGRVKVEWAENYWGSQGREK